MALQDDFALDSWPLSDFSIVGGSRQCCCFPEIPDSWPIPLWFGGFSTKHGLASKKNAPVGQKNKQLTATSYQLECASSRTPGGIHQTHWNHQEDPSTSVWHSFKISHTVRLNFRKITELRQGKPQNFAIPKRPNWPSLAWCSTYCLKTPMEPVEIHPAQSHVFGHRTWSHYSKQHHFNISPMRVFKGSFLGFPQALQTISPLTSTSGGELGLLRRGIQ